MASCSYSTEQSDLGSGDKGEDVVQHLIRVPFSSLNFEKKQSIISKGRSTPDLPKLMQDEKEFVRHFQRTRYDAIEWLTGSVTLNKLFCWPCLLFNIDKGTWNYNGFSQLNNLSRACQKHECSLAHLQATLRLKMFGQTCVDLKLDEHCRLEILKHNEMVRRNRDVLKRLIDVVCFLGQHELAFQGHDESVQSSGRNYVQLLQFLSRFDSVLCQHLETATVFSGTSSHVQNDIISSVAAVIDFSVKEELHKSTFVAVLTDEFSDVANLSQLSISVRYVTDDSGPKERFLRFIKVTDRSSHGISTLILQTLKEFKCLKKLVAQAFDGAPVIASNLQAVQSMIRNEAPDVIYVHCYAHILNLVLSQSVGYIRQCKIFFAALSGIAEFFTKSNKRTQLLDEVIKVRIPAVANTQWNYHSQIVNIVKENKRGLLELFHDIIDSAQEWDGETVSAASDFHQTLNDFEFSFLLTVFAAVFAYTDVLFSVLQAKRFDISYCQQKVKEVEEFLIGQREKFQEIYDSLEEDLGPPKKYSCGDNFETNTQYKQLFYEIIDCLLLQIGERFSDMVKLEFVALLDPSKFITHARAFPEDAFSSLKKTYSRHFDFVRLKNELTVMYTSKEFYGKYPQEIHKVLRDTGLGSFGFSETYKLVTLILTIPSTTATVERSFSALNRVKNYCKNTIGQERLSSLAKLSIEKELLLTLKSNTKFYDDVAKHFIKMEGRMEFHFK
uniref:Zinc finger MYM-type protein 1-like n=1 Tax=Geotrypetes seraphini TaxID=260995 RepID=A0A6P8QPX6_GEOSA|nr:zinc finger MYM-type protein 1-like [Geotrypetes seraphini]XP_033788668.1 zinc finger MYM-type protein 1-like [Geotrypetes seraphini]XP_033788669.1 zinc finger MYM-type protein 1-like [Geotrypetes seraphini]XP_033788671.1 zinc finger MYM-type protein 1-like [Geotrypetes seraphini]